MFGAPPAPATYTQGRAQGTTTEAVLVKNISKRGKGRSALGDVPHRGIADSSEAPKNDFDVGFGAYDVPHVQNNVLIGFNSEN